MLTEVTDRVEGGEPRVTCCVPLKFRVGSARDGCRGRTVRSSRFKVRNAPCTGAGAPTRNWCKAVHKLEPCGFIGNHASHRICSVNTISTVYKNNESLTHSLPLARPSRACGFAQWSSRSCQVFPVIEIVAIATCKPFAASPAAQVVSSRSYHIQMRNAESGMFACVRICSLMFGLRGKNVPQRHRTEAPDALGGLSKFDQI